MHTPRLQQLQHRHKGGNQLAAVTVVRPDILQAYLAAAVKTAQQVHDAARHRDNGLGDQRGKGSLLWGQAAPSSAARRPVGGGQLVHRVTAAVGGVYLQRHGRAGKYRPAGIPQAQQRRSLLAALVFQQLSHQLGAGVVLFLVAGQQAGGLDVHQPRSHLQKFAGDFHLVLLQGADIRHVLLQQGADVDIVNIDLMLGEQR